MIGQAHLTQPGLVPRPGGGLRPAAVDRLRSTPAFAIPVASSIYERIEEECPELFAGRPDPCRRWHVNGMIVQPDMNVPQGESFVRQALLAKRYLQQKLGVDVRIAYCVDSFGHAGTLPQILKKCGFDYYVFMRPQAHEKDLPAQAFWWEAPDGSRLLASHCRFLRRPGASSTSTTP